MFSRGVQFNSCSKFARESTDSKGRCRVVREVKSLVQRFTRTCGYHDLCIKNPNAIHGGCENPLPRHWRLPHTSRQKLEALQEAVSIKGISDWQTITPNRALRLDWTSAARRLPTVLPTRHQRKQRQARRMMLYSGLYSLGSGNK